MPKKLAIVPECPPIPKRLSSLQPKNRLSSLMPKNQQRIIEEKFGRHNRTCSTMSKISVASSNISEIIEKKIELCHAELDYCEAYREGLRTLQKNGAIAEEDIELELDATTECLTPVAHELDLLTKQRRLVEQDIVELLAVKKRKTDGGASQEFFENAYARVIVPRVMAASSRGLPKTFSSNDQHKFRDDVLSAYGALSADGSRAWCHLLGWHEKSLVRAAHLVPKILSGTEIKYLFAEDSSVLHNWRNGITLHKTIERALDNGDIAIIPVPPCDGGDDTRWKCVLVNKDPKETCTGMERGSVSWGELDGKELVFLTDNRPAMRYLYFRFIITYLNTRKRSPRKSFIDEVETQPRFWASPGAYLRKSTLATLARNISGLELPPSLMENTFGEEVEPEPEPASKSFELTLSNLLRSATLATHRANDAEAAKRKKGVPEDDDEDEDEDEEL